MPNSNESEAGYSGSGYTPIRAPRGNAISCKGWQQEAALRMLMNSVDPDVAEHPELLTACPDLGQVAADWSALGSIADSLRDLANDATLLVHGGKVESVFPTSADSSRALILDSAPVAGWTYIGPQAFLPKTYEAFSAAKQELFSGELSGKLVASTGMSGPRAALPLAATMHNAASLGIEDDSAIIKRCLKTGYCDVMVNSLDEALRILKNAVRKREAASVALIGRPADTLSEMASRGVVPDLLADFPLSRDPETLDPLQRATRDLQKLGSIVLDSLTSDNAFDSIHWVALSGEVSDIRRIDRLLLELFPDDEPLDRWIRTLQRRIRHQGLPARACRLSADQRRSLGVAVSRLVAEGELKAPVVIARHTPAQINRENESLKTRGFVPPSGDEFAALLKLSGGATWTSLDRDEHANARVTMQAVVADGTKEMDARIERVLSGNTLQQPEFG